VGDWWVEKWLVGRVIVCVMVADMFGGRKGEKGRLCFDFSGGQWHEIIVCGRERPYTWIFQAQSDTISTLRHGELLQSGLKGAFSGLHTTEPPRPSITTSNVCDKRVSPYVLLLLFHRGTSVPAEGQTDTPSLNLRSAQHLRQPHRRPRRLRWCPERAPHPIPQPVPNPDVLPDIHWV